MRVGGEGHTVGPHLPESMPGQKQPGVDGPILREGDCE